MAAFLVMLREGVEAALIVGILLAWPRLGVYVLTAAPGAISKLVPSAKLKDLLQPVDRRAPREGET